MKALTICQPYAHLIVRGEKRVENREWPTRYRGPLAIHAGKNRAWTDADEIGYYAREGDPMEFGAIVGIARLVDVLNIACIDRGDYDQRFPWLRGHRHTEGTWCWVLDQVQRINPMPARGAQGLWEWPIPEEFLLPANNQGNRHKPA